MQAIAVTKYFLALSFTYFVGSGKAFGIHPSAYCFFLLTAVYSYVPIASLLLFIKVPVCFCFISGAKVVRVLGQKQGRGLPVLLKNLHLCGDPQPF